MASSYGSEWQGFNTKWRDLISAADAAHLPNSAISQVQAIDYSRLASGSSYQLSRAEAFDAIRSAAGGRPVTPAPSQPFSWGRMPGYVGSDLKDFGVGLLGLFKKAVGDVVHPSRLEGQISALWRDPRTAFNNIAELVPGVADFETLAKHPGAAGFEQLAEHPFTSLLDVAPVVGVAGRLAGVGARAGLDAAASEALTQAARFGTADISAAATAARAGAREAVPSTLRRALVTASMDRNPSSPFGLANRLMFDTPFRDDTMGTYLARRLATSTRGNVGPVAASVGRLLQAANRTHAGAVKETVGDLGGFYGRHGIESLTERADFAWLLTHWRPDWQEAYAGRFGPEEIPKLSRALEEYDTRSQEILNADLEQGRLAVITDPRTGDTQIRATDGSDAPVVAAHKAFLARRNAAQERAFRLADATGKEIPLDPVGASQAVTQHVGELLQPLQPYATGFTVLGREGGNVTLGHLEARARELAGPQGLVSRLGASLARGRLDVATQMVNRIIPILRRATDQRLREALPAALEARAVLRFAQHSSTQNALRRYAVARDRLTRALDANPEARFQPRMTELVGQRLMAHLDGQSANVPDLEHLYDLAGNGLWHGQRFDEMVGPVEMAKITNSALAELRAEAASGLAPRFVYSVRPEEIEHLGSPRVNLERIQTSRSRHARTTVNPTAVFDPVLGLVRKQAEDLQERVVTEMFYGEDGVLARWGMTVDELNAQALQLVKEPKGPTLTTRAAEIEKWKQANARLYEPREFFPSQRPPSGLVPTAGDVYLPVEVHSALQSHIRATRAPQNIATRALSRGTSVFRYSLLNFSPRYQAHIWLGGAALALIRRPSAFRELPAAAGIMVNDAPALMRLAAHPVAGAPLRPVFDWLRRRADAGGTTHLPARISHELAEGDPQDLLNAYNHAAGVKLGKWYEKLARARGVANAGMELAAFGANLLRSAVYLSGARHGGEEEGIRLALKVYADMDSMTPLERQIIRYAMPFYGWTRHILVYTLTLPADHPFRAAVLSQMVNQEWSDWKTGIPKSMMYLLQLGGVAPDGSVTALDIRQLDPLRSVTDVFTLAGFASALNPAWQSVMVGLGINPQSGGPEELYPTYQLNDFYGNKQAMGQSIGKILAQGVGSFVPEFSVADHFLSLSSYTRWAKANNPQAYRNQLASALNFPWVPQSLNLRQIVARSEMDNYSLATAAVTAAMNDPDPNSPTWKTLLQYSYVPYAGGWLVQPSELRRWAFAQVARNGFWNGSVAALPPSQVVTPPAAPKIA